MWTGNSAIDGIVHDVVAACESALPNRELSYYVIGSWAEGRVNALSDIDLAIVWPGAGPTDEERHQADQVLASLTPAVRLDAVIFAEWALPVSAVGVNVKLSSALFYGPDIRDRLPLPPLDLYTEKAKETAYLFMSRILRGVEVIDQLDYPDRHDEFYRYTVKRVEAWYPPEVISGLKEWISTATRIARALVATQCGQYVGSKRQAIAAYSACIGGEWSDYLDTLYQKGKFEWGYRVPENSADRALLRELSGRFLALEQRFLAISQA